MRYFFHIKSSDGVAHDRVGLELHSPRVARHEAICAARELTSELATEGTSDLSWTILIEDEEGSLVAHVGSDTPLN